MFNPCLIGMGMAKRNHQVTILTTSRPDGVEMEEPLPGLRIHYIKDTLPDRYSEPYWIHSALKFDELHSVNPFDVVSSDSDAGFGWIQISKFKDVVPFVTVKHNTLSTLNDMIRFQENVDGDQARLFNEEWFQKVTRPVMLRAHAIICDSRAIADAVLQDCPDTDGKLHVVYHSGVELDRFRSNEAAACEVREELNLDKEKIVLYVGRLSHEKGVDCLLESVPHIRNSSFRMILVGAGSEDYVNRLNGLIAQLRVEERVIIVPGISSELVPVFLELADVFVLASIFDAFPSAIVEAFAAGKPVVATRVGGVPEIVEDGVNGYLVPRMEPRTLAEKIDSLLEDEDKRRSFGREGQRRVAERFTLGRMIDGAEVIFSDLASQVEEAFQG